MLCRTLRITHDLRFTRPRVDTFTHLPEGATEPHQPEDNCGVLWAEADKEGSRRGGTGGWEGH